MIVRLEKPLIATQLDRALELVRRVRDGQLTCVFIFGPKGIGKTEIVEIAYHGSGVHLTPIPDATLYGMRQMFVVDPSGHFWLDDNDQWLKQLRDVNFMKRVLQGGAIEAINRDTLNAAMRDGNLPDAVLQVKSSIRLIVTSNASFDALGAEQRNHVEAVTDRGSRINISSDPRELLKFLDWWIVEQDYFATEIFRGEANINRRLNLREIQDVLNFVHRHAWRLSLSLRTMRDTAVERVMSPGDWDTKLIAGLLPEPQLKIDPPPAPEMFGRNVREGLPIKPNGYERRQAKRAKREADSAPPDAPPGPEPSRPTPSSGTAQEFKRLINQGWSIADIAEKYGRMPAEIEQSFSANDPPPIVPPPIDRSVAVRSTDVGLAADDADDPPVPQTLGRGRPRTTKQAPPAAADPARLTIPWFIQESLAVTAGVFRNALVTASEAEVTLQAMNDTKTVFLLAAFPPIPDLGTAAWLNIKPMSFETADPGEAQQPEIGTICWEQQFDLDAVVAGLAEHKLGGDRKGIPATAFVPEWEKEMWFHIKNVAAVIRKKPQVWRLSKRRGVIGAELERDGIMYEYLIRAVPG